MFRRHHGHGLLGLILAFLGIRCAFGHCSGKEVDREEMRAKAKAFRSKMKEAFEVWRPEPEAESEAQSEAQPEVGHDSDKGI